MPELGWHASALRESQLIAPRVLRDTSTRCRNDLGVGCVLSFSLVILALLPHASPALSLAEPSRQQRGASWRLTSARTIPVKSSEMGGATLSLFKGVATLRLRGGKSGRRRKCAGLRRGGRVRKKDAYLRRKRETKRDEERSTVPLKGRGGKRKGLFRNTRSSAISHAR